MLHLGSLKTGWQSSWKILRKIYATYCGGQIGGLNRTSKLRRHDDAVKKKGEAFGGSQKKRLQGSTSTTPLLLFCLGNSFDRTSNGFGWIFFFGGGTPSIASLGWYFNLCDLMLRQKMNIWVGQMTILTMINYEYFCINRSMSMANSSFMHSIDTRWTCYYL